MYVVIAGAGLIGGALTRELLEKSHDVVVVDRDKEVCDRLYAETGAVVVNGAVASIAVLKEAHIEKADIAVAATGSDPDNLTFAMLAKSLGVPQVIARMRDPAYEQAYRVAGVDTVLHVTDLMVNQMMMEIEKPKVRRISSLGGGRADVFVVTVPPGAKVAGRSVSDIAREREFPAQCVFIAVYNKDTEKFAIPRGDQMINEGDELFLVATAGDITQAADILTGKG